jgi:hypothetical protein
VHILSYVVEKQVINVFGPLWPACPYIELIAIFKVQWQGRSVITDDLIKLRLRQPFPTWWIPA